MAERPTAGELVEAVREFLERDVMPALEGRLAFHTRVAVNALGIVERELACSTGLDERRRDRLMTLLGPHGEPSGPRSTDELARELAQRIRAGEFDDRIAEVAAVLRDDTRELLDIANPGYAAE